MRRLRNTLGLTALIICFLSTFVIAQSKLDKTVIGKVGKEKVTYGELKQNMLNSNTTSLTYEEMKEFLPTYLDYKAKIQFAEKEGVLENEELQKELELYGKQAAYSYWLENVIKETEFEKYYNRASTEIKSEHLLIAVSPNAPPEDTLDAYNKLVEARDKFLSGTSLSELDAEYSTKQNGRSMGGDLPWFSMGTTVKEFEDVIYSLEKGEISMPFRTQFGYHIVHLQDKRERSASREVSHIFKRGNQEKVKEDIDKAYLALEEGKTWMEVVIEESEDQISATSGGKIGWINYGRYDTKFVDSIMELDPSLDYSKPVKTVYGYHIFRIDSIQTFESDEAKRGVYMQEFLDSPNFKKSNTYIANWFKSQFENTVNKSVASNYEGYIRSNDTLKIQNIATPSFKNNTLYTFRSYSSTVEDFHNYLKETHPNASAKTYSKDWLEDFKISIIDSKMIEMTIQQFPEFQATIENYKKGLAVYQINDTHLWSAATVDTSQLLQIYSNNMDKYSYPDRYYYHMLSALTDTSLQKGIDFVKQGNSPDSVRTYFPKVAINKDSTGVFTDEPYDRLEGMKEGTFSDKFEYKRRSAIFYLNEILPARQMSFDEAFNRVLADYQPQREEKWLANLRKNYKVKVDLKKLKQAFDKDKSL